MNPRDIVEAILEGCPHGDGCEKHCPMKLIRESDDPKATLDLICDSEVADIVQIHRLCLRERRSPRPKP